MLALRSCTTAAWLRLLPFPISVPRSNSLLWSPSINTRVSSPYTLAARHSSFTPSRFRDHRASKKKNESKETIRHKATTVQQAQKTELSKKEKKEEIAKKKEKKLAKKKLQEQRKKEKYAKKAEKAKLKEKEEKARSSDKEEETNLDEEEPELVKPKRTKKDTKPQNTPSSTKSTREKKDAKPQNIPITTKPKQAKKDAKPQSAPTSTELTREKKDENLQSTPITTKPKQATKDAKPQTISITTTTPPPPPPPRPSPSPPPQPPQQEKDEVPQQSVSRVRSAVSQDVFPIIAIVGRPNVGKSTLFNRLALGDKRALIANVAGTTRDRDYASCRWYGRDLIVVDTGGIVGEGGTKGMMEGDKKTRSLAAMVREQALIAINEASTIVFVLNIHEGVTPHDIIIARMLRQRKKHVILVVNKADNQDLREFHFEEHKAEYIRLGFGEPTVTSAIHGEGFPEILDRILEPYPEVPEDDSKSKEIRVAIVGQPNAGKSSLLNKITGEERSVVSPIAGTTSDPVDTLITWRGSHRVRLIDTAGIWRRAKDSLARAAVIWALRVVQRAHVVILVIDGTVGVTEHDKHVAGFVVEHMKSVIVAVNKWDTYPKLKREREEEKPAREKMSHYQWLMHAKDYADKIIANDKAGMVAWEKGKSVKPAKSTKTKGKPKEEKEETPQEDEPAAIEQDEAVPKVEVVKRGSKDEGEISQVTKDILEADEKQTKKNIKKGKQEDAPPSYDDIDFDALEHTAEEFDISFNSESQSADTEKGDGEDKQQTQVEERVNKPRAKQHKATQDELQYEEAARSQLSFLPFVPFTFISATTGYRVPSLMDLAVDVFHERGKHIKTQDMYEVLKTAALRHKLPGKGKNLLRVRFATQVNAYPPTFVFFVNNPEAVKEHYEKFLETCIREKYQFVGTPIRLLFKKNSNKYTDEKK